jgi:hypothetical protein
MGQRTGTKVSDNAAAHPRAFSRLSARSVVSTRLWNCVPPPRAEISKPKEMLIRNNAGEVIGELNTVITQDHTVIRTNTVYKNGRTVTQNITVRDNQGNVHTTNVIGGKLLP